MSRSRLGRGLEALIPGPQDEGGPTSIPLELVDPNPYQPRRHFAQESLDTLAESISIHGVLQPVVVRKQQDRYEILAGERRCRAARLAGLETIPALVKDLSDEKMMELSIVENLQREDLNPLEEAAGFEQLGTRLGLTQGEIAQRIGRSRPHVANSLRLLQLPAAIKEYVSRETLSAGHARALLGLADEKLQLNLADRVIRQGLNVRQTEALVQQHRPQTGRVSRETKPTKTPEYLDMERRLTLALGTQVRLLPGRKQGRIEIVYYDSEELERLLEVLLERR